MREESQQRAVTIVYASHVFDGLGAFATNIRWFYAGSVLALAPMVVLYVLMQRWLLRGLLAGAVKG